MKLRTWLLASLLMSQTAVYAASAAHNQQQQIDELNVQLAQYETRDPLIRYQAYKAKMWLSYALNENSEGSLTVAGQEALQQAQHLINALTQGQTASLTTPVLSVSQVMRRDLWQQAEYLKQHGAIHHAPESLAHAEVMLVWAAAEYCELGWRHANEHFRAAEQSLYQAVNASAVKTRDMRWNHQDLPSMDELNGQGCRGVNAKFWPLTQTETTTLNDTVKAQNIVHFALDSAVLSPASQTVLDGLIQALKPYPQAELKLLGYTDSRASQTYNLKLAERRIQAVQQYLIGQGIGANRIQSVAKGAQDLQSDSDMHIAHAKSRRVLILLNEAGQIQLEPQWQDLQVDLEQKQVKVN